MNINSELSNKLPVHSGVLQGSTSGTFKFISTIYSTYSYPTLLIPDTSTTIELYIFFPIQENTSVQKKNQQWLH